MIILDAKTQEQIPLPEELYCISASSTVTNTFIKIAGHFGNYPLKNSATIGMKNFNITGTIEAKNIKDVEEIRSKIIYELYNKELLFFRYEDDERLYKCVLNGSVNVAYNAGYNIGRAFTINFVLTSYDGLAWSKKIYKQKLKVGEVNTVAYFGQIPITPYIEIMSKPTEHIQADFQIKKSDAAPFIQCNYQNGDVREVRFNKDIGCVTKLIEIEDGIPIIRKKLIKDVNQNSLLNPIVLRCERNEITINNHFIPNDIEVEITLTYRECFY